MTKYSHSEVQATNSSTQSARLSVSANFGSFDSTIAEFVSSSALTGPGWDSAKSALSPYSVVSKALYNYHCDFGETYTTFVSSFEAEVGETGKVLDTEELAELQAKISRIQHEKQQLMQKIAGNIALEILGGYGLRMQDFQINQAQKKVDILEKYEQFENTHSSDFSDVLSVGSTLETALSELGKSKSFDSATGMYTSKSLTSSDWYNSLTTYNDNSPSQRIEIVKDDKFGYVLKVYVNGVYNKQASDNLMYIQSKDGMKELGISLGHMAGELTGAYSIYRLFTGKDPVTGDRANRLEAALWTALLFLPASKMVSAAKELRAGNRALNGLDLTAKELEILSKSGYFNDVGKLAKLEKASGAGGEIGKYSVETLNRDQTRIVVENLLDNGEISLKDLQNMIPEGTPNTFKATETMKNGAKYEFQLSDGQKAIVRWHEPDPIAAAKFPDSASGSRWTAQIKIGNKQVTIDGLWTKKQNLNEVHVPIQGR